MAVEMGQIIVVGAFMFVSGIGSMHGLVSPSDVDPMPDVVLSGLLTLLSGGIALVFLSAFFVPRANNIHGYLGVAWLVGAALMLLLGRGGN